MSNITWEEGKYSALYATVNGIRIGSVQYDVVKHEPGKGYKAYFDLPGIKVKEELQFSQNEAKECIARIWDKWLKRVTETSDGSTK